MYTNVEEIKLAKTFEYWLMKGWVKRQKGKRLEGGNHERVEGCKSRGGKGRRAEGWKNRKIQGQKDRKIETKKYRKMDKWMEGQER